MGKFLFRLKMPPLCCLRGGKRAAAHTRAVARLAVPALFLWSCYGSAELGAPKRVSLGSNGPAALETFLGEVSSAFLAAAPSLAQPPAASEAADTSSEADGSSPQRTVSPLPQSLAAVLGFLVAAIIVGPALVMGPVETLPLGIAALWDSWRCFTSRAVCLRHALWALWELPWRARSCLCPAELSNMP